MTPPSNGNDTSPDQVDLRDTLWPVEDLGAIIASAASAAATALEYHCNRMGEPPTDLSTLFIHYNARLASGNEGKNVGTTMSAVMKAITSHGACREATWPFDPARLTEKPPAQAYDEARKFMVATGETAADAIEALGLRYPVPVVVKLPHRCLREVGRDGVMPGPTPAEMAKPDALINHAMVLVGYDKRARTFLARNCWGTTWGDQGHCTISFEMMKAITPGTHRLWFITSTSNQAQAAPQAVFPQTVPSPTQPERLSDVTARMRQELRGDLQRDLDEATRRVREMTARRPVATTSSTKGFCPTCGGGGSCITCGSKGCTMCGRTGRCPNCGGSGNG